MTKVRSHILLWLVAVLEFVTSQKLHSSSLKSYRNPKGHSWSSNHPFSGVNSLLNFKGVNLCGVSLGGGFKHVLFSPLFGEIFSNLTCAYFSDGLVKNHQLDLCGDLK